MKYHWAAGVGFHGTYGRNWGMAWRDKLSVHKVSRCVSVPFASSCVIFRQGCSVKARKTARNQKRKGSLLLAFRAREPRTFPNFWTRVRLRMAASEAPAPNWSLSRSPFHHDDINPKCEGSTLLTSSSPKVHHPRSRISIYKLGRGRAFGSAFSLFQQHTQACLAIDPIFWLHDTTLWPVLWEHQAILVVLPDWFFTLSQQQGSISG